MANEDKRNSAAETLDIEGSVLNYTGSRTGEVEKRMTAKDQRLPVYLNSPGRLEPAISGLPLNALQSRHS
jgi:hypothetical protein